MAAYNIFKEDTGRVCAQFEQFNSMYDSLIQVFKKVTDESYIPGVQLKFEKPIAKVAPALRSAKEKRISGIKHNPKLRSFLEKYDLLELEAVLNDQGVELNDILEMDQDEIESIGIERYRDRKSLLRAI